MKPEMAEAFGFLSLAALAPARKGAEAWMAAQITGTWTAFESMAEDLWVAALNEHPQTLAQLAGQKNAKRDDDSKKIDLNDLQICGYEVRHKMGDILRSKYHFDSAAGIRKAYGDAFSEPPETVHNILKDRSLKAISIVRNNLVHSGGVIDRDYYEFRSHLPVAAQGEINSEIALDGDLVVALTEPVIVAGQNLIKAVESWMKIN
jgi:hypothetical protein